MKKPIKFTIGSNLKGELWESTAVNELRSQAEKIAEKLKSRLQTNTADKEEYSTK